MKDETKDWINYARENLESAEILLDSKLFNPCLQNIQQSVEKALKALFIENSLQLKKTHSITELRNILSDNKIQIEIPDEECEFLDSIYLPSKYPVWSVLANYEPDTDICNEGIEIATKVLAFVQKIYP